MTIENIPIDFFFYLEDTYGVELGLVVLSKTESTSYHTECYIMELKQKNGAHIGRYTIPYPNLDSFILKHYIEAIVKAFVEQYKEE